MLHEELRKVQGGCGSFDALTKNRVGNFVARRGFFYRLSWDANKFMMKVSDGLTRLALPHLVVSKGEKWAPFRGGQSVAQGSHWWVEFKLLNAMPADGKFLQLGPGVLASSLTNTKG